MAASTRSSRIPRARSCDKTICSRSWAEESGSNSACMQVVLQNNTSDAGGSVILLKVAGQGSRTTQLLQAMSKEDVEAEDAVLVADPNDGDVSRDVVFALDDLLGGLRGLGAISDG